jgi:hypothetical protein
MDEKSMDLIDSFPITRQQSSTNAASNMSLVDWGGAVLQRCFGDDIQELRLVTRLYK